MISIQILASPTSPIMTFFAKKDSWWLRGAGYQESAAWGTQQSPKSELRATGHSAFGVRDTASMAHIVEGQHPVVFYVEDRSTKARVIEWFQPEPRRRVCRNYRARGYRRLR